MDIYRKGSRDANTPNPDYFTGAVRIEPVIAAPAPARVVALVVTFEPRARTAWHCHPFGQTLLVLTGTCLAQSEGQPVRVLSPGDVAWFAPGEKHWHGASPDGPMAHLAMQEAEGGRTADWMEKVSDADYDGPRG